MQYNNDTNEENKTIQKSTYGDTLELSQEKEKNQTNKMIYSDNGAKGILNTTRR